ncbi:MAG: fructosamine kinase family protein [Crocinitomicaceae bacterium]
MLEKEAIGLKELSQKSSFCIPEVIGHFEDENQQYLILGFIESGNQSVNFWSDFGEQLATLHQVSSDSFGWKSDNYIGSLPQKNDKRNDWGSFYAEMRILPQLKMAFDKGWINSTDIRNGEKLCLQFDALFPKEAPALLHGDLWSGNYMTDASGNPVLIDPAVYYGHREMDLGMMHLFGGFSQVLFDAYHAHFPLEKLWRERIPLTQLYPLLVHVNLFGGTYVQSVRSIFQKYS